MDSDDQLTLLHVFGWWEWAGQIVGWLMLGPR